MAALLGVAAAGAVPLAGVADREAAWFDYRGFAEEFGPANPVRFDWTQGYGPIDWPRTRAEVLRVKADEPAYWKLRTLEDFDGVAWRDRRSDQRFANLPRADPELDLPYGWERRPEWIQEFEVSLRRLQGDEVLGAGTTLRVTGSTQRLRSAAEPGMWRGVEEFGRGDSYTVRAYVPRPTAGDLETSTSGRQADELGLTVPLLGGGPASLRAATGGVPVGTARVRFRAFEPRGAGDAPAATYATVNRTGPGEEALRASPFARTWRLAQRLHARAASPYEYVALVAAHLRNGFTYSERPPAPAPGQAPLEAFIFESRRGYCQQFAGAMALLLRMGGVPARVATGFTPGGFSERKGAWIVRDTDAHAWVEAWFDRFGWVALDPTPPATPARSQIASLAPQGATDSSLPGLGTVGTTPEGTTRSPQGGLTSGGPRSGVAGTAGDGRRRRGRAGVAGRGRRRPGARAAPALGVASRAAAPRSRRGGRRDAARPRRGRARGGAAAQRPPRRPGHDAPAARAAPRRAARGRGLSAGPALGPLRPGLGAAGAPDAGPAPRASAARSRREAARARGCARCGRCRPGAGESAAPGLARAPHPESPRPRGSRAARLREPGRAHERRALKGGAPGAAQSSVLSEHCRAVPLRGTSSTKLSRRVRRGATPGASPRGCAPAGARSRCRRASWPRRRPGGARR